jgi:hypothetical protein
MIIQLGTFHRHHEREKKTAVVFKVKVEELLSLKKTI